MEFRPDDCASAFRPSYSHRALLPGCHPRPAAPVRSVLARHVFPLHRPPAAAELNPHALVHWMPPIDAVPMFKADALSGDKIEQYAQLLEQARGLMHGEPDRVANAANLAALVFHALPQLNWVGFYFYDGRELVVGPFQGLPACVRIALGRGVCGTAATTRQTQRIADVHEFPGHIACDAASRSELVVPLYDGDTLIGVFDLDSPEPGRFDAIDQQGLEAIALAYIASTQTA